jgi:hypothetical protein
VEIALRRDTQHDAFGIRKEKIFLDAFLYGAVARHVCLRWKTGHDFKYFIWLHRGCRRFIFSIHRELEAQRQVPALSRCRGQLLDWKVGDKSDHFLY